jgi:hypothetical protein
MLAHALDAQGHLSHAVKQAWLLCHAGLVEHGGSIVYKAHVKQVLTEPGPGGRLRATGVRLADGRTFNGKVREPILRLLTGKD